MSPGLLSLTIVCAAVPLLGAGAVPTGERQDVFATGPRLDEVPGPRAVGPGLPPPAQWPVLRYRHPLRILVVTGKRSLAAFQRIARRMRSTVEFRYADQAGFSMYHVNDKWIEPKNNPTTGELDDYVRRVATEALSPRGGMPPADVIFSDLIDIPGLLASVKAGAVLSLAAKFIPESRSPFAVEWPARLLQNRDWMDEGARRSEAA